MWDAGLLCVGGLNSLLVGAGEIWVCFEEYRFMRGWIVRVCFFVSELRGLSSVGFGDDGWGFNPQDRKRFSLLFDQLCKQTRVVGFRCRQDNYWAVLQFSSD